MRPRRVHFVGIGGIGMSGIAELLHHQGFAVTGSDLAENANVRRLRSLGIPIFIGHRAEQVGKAEIVVVTSAAKEDNPEIVEARRRGIPVLPRAQMLAELMRMKQGIAIAGSHGKTTITSMIAQAMDRLGFDPTYVIGGRLIASGQNARLGESDWLVAEADESDGSFLRLSPRIAVVANIDPEHLDHYGSFEALVDAFAEFALRTPFDGLVVLHHEHPHLGRVRERIARPIVSYGTSPQADLRWCDRRVQGFSQRLQIERRGKRLGELIVPVPGAHNADNALAALAVLLALDVGFADAAAAIGAFSGIERRMQRTEIGAGLLIDDYAHHPREIEAVLATIRECVPERRLRVLFQPHRYTRTRDLFDEFAGAFDLADTVALLPIYPAQEAPIPGISHERLAAAIAMRGHRDVRTLPDLDAGADWAAEGLRRGEVVLVAGAGSIAQVAARLRKELAR